jgi:hypothetical protein
MRRYSVFAGIEIKQDDNTQSPPTTKEATCSP